MIDWVTCELPLAHAPLESGLVCKVSPDGDLEWAVRCRVQVQGSHESSIQVRSIGGDGAGEATGLHFSGNPSKFLQGHNVFGSDDLVLLMYDAFIAICRSLNLTPSVGEVRKVKQGIYPLSMVDINQSYELPTRQDVLAWIRAAEYKSRTRHGRPQSKGGTLYWGKSSQRWSLKVYSKGEEIEASKHQLPEALQATSIPKWANNKLRLELRIKRKQLAEHGITEARDLTDNRAREIFFEYARKLDMKEQIALTTEQQLKLPQRLRSTYVLWRSGEDLRSTLPKPTYYRHRKELLAHGIDIAIARDTIDRSNVVPLIRVLEATPASIPEWAFSQRLIHRSAKPLSYSQTS